MWKFIPLILFFGLLGFLARGLQIDPSELPSPLIEQPAPSFKLQSLFDANEYGPEDFTGEGNRTPRARTTQRD